MSQLPGFVEDLHFIVLHGSKLVLIYPVVDQSGHKECKIMQKFVVVNYYVSLSVMICLNSV